MTIIVILLLSLAVAATATLPLVQFPVVVFLWILALVAFSELVHMSLTRLSPPESKEK